jgi:Leucine-rich repeat (LRR) protein
VFPKRETSRKYSDQIGGLDFYGNEITVFPGNHLKGLSISLLDFSNNKLTHIDEEAFNGIGRLEVIDFSNNKLTTLSANVFKPIAETLISLKLAHNELSAMTSNDLGASLSKLTRLTTLVLRHNKLTKMPNLSTMNRLEELILSSNQIESLVDDKGNSLLPSTTVEFSIENNRLTQINDNTFDNAKNIKYLNLASNQISSISKNAFINLRNLRSLNLRKNHLKEIPTHIFFNAKYLERLDLSSQNQVLTSIDDYAFDRHSNFQAIRKIDLSNNRIEKISSKAFCSRNKSFPHINIREIDLAVNAITKLNACVLRQLSKVSRIYFVFNLESLFIYFFIYSI